MLYSSVFGESVVAYPHNQKESHWVPTEYHTQGLQLRSAVTGLQLTFAVNQIE